MSTRLSYKSQLRSHGVCSKASTRRLRFHDLASSARSNPCLLLIYAEVGKPLIPVCPRLILLCYLIPLCSVSRREVIEAGQKVAEIHG